MKIRDQEITLPASMFGNYPNPLWWDIYFTRFFSEEKQPPDTFDCKTWKDLMATLVHDQGLAGLYMISVERVYAGSYAGQADYCNYKCTRYDLRGGNLGFPIYNHLHSATLTQEVKHRDQMMEHQIRAIDS